MLRAPAASDDVVKVVLPKTRAAPLPKPETAVGVRRAVAVVESPIAPRELVPQHWMAPVVVIAQVLLDPPAIELTPLRPLTSTGVRLRVVLLLPSWPLLLAPQHLTPPPDAIRT